MKFYDGFLTVLKRALLAIVKVSSALEVYVKSIFEHADGTIHFYRIVNILVSLLNETQVCTGQGEEKQFNAWETCRSSRF